METVDIALKQLKIGHEIRQPGEPVPEARFFRRRKALYNQGHLKAVPFEELTADQRLFLAEKLGKMEPQHVGGGMYELPDGTRVRGKEAAQQAIEKGAE